MSQERLLRYNEVKKTIEQEATRTPSWKRKVGLLRERKAEDAFEALKAAGYITGYLHTGRLSMEDIFFGIDFQVSYIKKDKRVSMPISVTGPRYVASDRKQHPRVPVLAIRVCDDLQTVKDKILSLLF